jgi:hypothetical protein
MRSQIRPFNSKKALVFDLQISAGSPKYFSYRTVEVTPAKERIKDRVPSFVFLLKKIEVFPRFNC